MSKAADDVLAERARQMGAEGWSTEHDDTEHDEQQLARAAYCYVGHYFMRSWLVDPPNGDPIKYVSSDEPPDWPWLSDWWKPKNPRRDLVRAAALLIAEIERLDRASGE